MAGPTLPGSQQSCQNNRHNRHNHLTNRPINQPPAGKFTAADVYTHNAELAVQRAAALAQLAKVDLLLVPTAAAHYTIEVRAS